MSVFIFSYYKMPLQFIEIVRSKLRAQQKNCMLYMYILEILKFRFLKNVCNIPSMQAHFKVCHEQEMLCVDLGLCVASSPINKTPLVLTPCDIGLVLGGAIF